MRITKLSLTDYRNIESCVFEPGEGINVIYGNNAQGKTNLIEALWMFCGQKSFRGTKDTQLIRLNCEKAEMKMEFFAADRPQKAEIKITSKKDASINDIPLTTPSLLGDSFCAVVFAPSHMDLIQDGPKERRAFLDGAISQMRPKYAKVLQIYNRAVMQRNVILRDVMFHSELEFMLEAFEQKIANCGAYIIAQRKMFLEALCAAAPEIYSGISQNKEKFTMEYICTADDGLEKTLLHALRQARAEDTAKQVTSVGPHRDDIDFFVDGLPLKTFGSQGQKRSAVLAIKLAQAQVLKRFCGEQPVAILDDVMSELDRERQDFILNHIKGWQVFITCCDPQTVRHLDEGNVFKMDNGVLTKEK